MEIRQPRGPLTIGPLDDDQERVERDLKPLVRLVGKPLGQKARQDHHIALGRAQGKIEVQV